MTNNRFDSFAAIVAVICSLAAIVIALSESYVLSKIVLPRVASPTVTLPRPTQGSIADVSKVVYDAKITIPGTGVTVSYPKQGYNGKGVRIGKSKESALMVYDKIANLYVLSKPYDIPYISVDVFKLGNEKTLDDVIAYITREQMPNVPGSRYQTIDGRRYYLVPEFEGNPIYSAYTIANGRLVNIILQGGFIMEQDDATPELLVQVLKHIDYSCKGDCSSNADPVIDMGKQGEE